MTPAALALVFGLLRQVDDLKAVHRSGDTPSFGQVEALFDQAAVVRAALNASDSARPANWPTSPTRLSPIEKATRHLVELLVADLHGATRSPEGRS